MMTLPCGPLSCPEPENYAAVAKQLHETALETEACIYEQEIALRSMVNRPTIVRVNTLTITGLVASLDQSVIGGDAVTVFDNTGRAFDEYIQESTGIWRFLGEGMYEVGWTAWAVASAAVTDNSVRIFHIEHRRPNPESSIGYDLINHAGFTLFESNTGIGVECSFSAMFRIRPFDYVNFMFFHDNASTINIQPGMYSWMSKVSDVSLRQVL